MIWGPGLPGPIGPTGPQGPAGAAGKVLQVVHASTTTEVIVSGTTAFTDSTLTASITPSSASSMILVLVSQALYVFNGVDATQIAAAGAIQVVRGSTAIWQGRETATGPNQFSSLVSMASATVSEVSLTNQFPIIVLDSPATTSSTAYKTQIRAQTTNNQVHAQLNGSVRNGRSNIILMEIAA